MSISETETNLHNPVDFHERKTPKHPTSAYESDNSATSMTHQELHLFEDIRRCTSNILNHLLSDLSKS